MTIVSGLSLTGATGLGATAAQAIANGRAAQDGEFPFAVKLSMTGIPTADGGRRDSACTGGLIAPHWVLTAGHCFRDATEKRVSRPVARKTVAIVGRADLDGTAGQEATVVAVRQSTVADVAVARLDRDITGITPMRLGQAQPEIGTIVQLTGFGLLTSEAAEPARRMQIGEFTVTSVTRTELGMTGRSPSSDTSPCPKDSGGPYFTFDGSGLPVVLGVVSDGPWCPHTGPDRASRIDTVAPWIRGVIGPDSAPSTPQPTDATGDARATSVVATAGTGLPVLIGGAVVALVIALLCIGLAILLARRDRRRLG